MTAGTTTAVTSAIPNQSTILSAINNNRNIDPALLRTGSLITPGTLAEVDRDSAAAELNLINSFAGGDPGAHELLTFAGDGLDEDEDEDADVEAEVIDLEDDGIISIFL